MRVKKISGRGSNESLSFFYTIKDALTLGSFTVTQSLPNLRLNIFPLIAKSEKSYPIELTACTLSYKIKNI